MQTGEQQVVVVLVMGGQHTPHVDSTAIFANAVGNTNEPRPFLQLEATLIAIVRVKIC